MDTQIVIYPHNGILISNEKEQTTATDTTDQSQTIIAKEAKQRTVHTVRCNCKKFQNWQNLSTILEITTVATSGR